MAVLTAALLLAGVAAAARTATGGPDRPAAAGLVSTVRVAPSAPGPHPAGPVGTEIAPPATPWLGRAWMVRWPAVPRPAWVAVPVATVWNRPAAARPEDDPAVSAQPDVAGWLASLSYQQKLGLDDLVATQALLDQPVVVVGHDGAWDRILVRAQTGSVYPSGISGWVPESQVTYRHPPPAPRQATVDVPVLRVGDQTLSYGTTLPVEPTGAAATTVDLATGRFPVASSALRLGPLERSGAAVVAQARRFLGLQYMWAGTSAFGFDCSGLTYTVYRQFGVSLARDAADQALQGRPVAPADLVPGDLVFFAFDGHTVDHVGIYAGDGRMIDAPHTGAAVEVVPLWTPGLAPYFAGARRYI